MNSANLRERLEYASHLLNEIRFSENILDELFFARPTVSIAPPPVHFFQNYTQKIFDSVQSAKDDYNDSFKSGSPSYTPPDTLASQNKPIDYPENFGEIIGTRIRDHRNALGMTQNELAEKTNIRRPNIARLEKGQSLPNLATLLRVSSALCISLDILLENS